MDSLVRILRTERPTTQLIMRYITPTGDAIFDAGINACNTVYVPWAKNTTVVAWTCMNHSCSETLFNRSWL